MQTLDRLALRDWPLPQPGDGSDKEDRGQVLVVAGSREIPGAALLSATAALRAGAGKLTIATAQSVAPGLALLTPHAGEMAHLSGQSKDDVKADAPALARAMAVKHNAVVALKGATTFIIAPQGASWCHVSANAGLGTSGSGDVLAGIMTGLAARGAPLVQAAAWGVFLHALAGQRLAERHGRLGFLAREILKEIASVMRDP